MAWVENAFCDGADVFSAGAAKGSEVGKGTRSGEDLAVADAGVHGHQRCIIGLRHANSARALLPEPGPVEDQGGAPTLEVIRSRFSDRVAAIVDGCSDTDAIPKPPWEQRKRAYIGSIADASRSVLLLLFIYI